MYEYYFITYIPEVEWYSPTADPLTVKIKSRYTSFSWQNNKDLSPVVNNLIEEGATILDIFRVDFLTKKKISVFK